MKIIYYLYNHGKYPSAAWGRVRLIVRGLQANGVDAEIYPIKSPFGLNKFFRPFILLWQVIVLYFDLFWKKDSIIISYGYNYTWSLFYLPRRAKVFVERNEYPNFLIRNAKRYSLFEDSPLKQIDGFITCTFNLKNHYSQFCKKDCPFFILPVIVDIKEFDGDTQHDKKITYCGDWGNNKDGVDILIKSFALFFKKHPDYTLELIGGSTKDVEDSLKALANDLQIGERVSFVGRVPHEQMATYLLSASVLALARPNNKQAEGGFPSKVAEYLATGRPVVLTNVGEQHLYLKDNYNCFMSEPDSVELFAEKLCEAIESDNMENVAKQGKITAIQFDYSIQAKRLVEFIEKEKIINK